MSGSITMNRTTYSRQGFMLFSGLLTLFLLFHSTSAYSGVSFSQIDLTWLITLTLMPAGYVLTLLALALYRINTFFKYTAHVLFLLASGIFSSYLWALIREIQTSDTFYGGDGILLALIPLLLATIFVYLYVKKRQSADVQAGAVRLIACLSIIGIAIVGWNLWPDNHRTQTRTTQRAPEASATRIESKLVRDRKAPIQLPPAPEQPVVTFPEPPRPKIMKLNGPKALETRQAPANTTRDQ